MNKDLLRLLELLKLWNGGEISGLISEEFEAFSNEKDYQIKTIDDLIEAMEIEMSYFEN